MRAYVQILACVLSAASAAQTTFNVVRHHPSILSYAGGISVFEQQDGYLMFSYGWSLDSAVGAVQIAKFDFEGNFLWDTEHSRQRYMFPGYIDPIARISDTCFVAGMTEFGGLAPNITWLYWFNAQGDTIRTRFLKSDSGLVDANHGTRQLVALADGGFLHCGWCGVPQNTGCITRLDSAGAFLWERVYPGTNYIFNATELADGGFVLGGSRPPDVPQNQAVVIRTDSAGNVQWVRYHGQYAITGGEQALVDDDGSILMAGVWKDDPNPQTYDRWSSLYRYSSNGTLLARKDYFYSYNATAVFVLPKTSGRFWLVGGMNQYILNPDGVLTLWELDENLDSLWMRRYWYYAPDGAESAAYCVRSTTDEGLVMCGMTRQGITDPLPYLQSNWLIKLDSYGCLVPGCQNVGIDEVALGLNEYLSVSPNPVAQGQRLRIEFDPPAGFTPKGTLRVVMLDALGKEVHAEQFASHSSALTLHTSLPAGVYYIHLTDGSSWLAGGKVVVE